MSPSIARGISEPLRLSPWPQNQVERNIWRANGLAVAVVLLVALINSIGLHAREGTWAVAVGDAVARTMLFAGIPHYVIAMVFMLTSSANQTPQRRARLAVSSLLGVVLCLLYAAAGGPPLPGASGYLRQLDGGLSARALPLTGLVAVYVFFLIHEIVDEASFLSRHDYPEEPTASTPRLVARVLLPSTLALLAAAGWIATAFGAYDGTQPILPADSPFAVRVVAAAIPLVGVSFAINLLWKRWARADRVLPERVISNCWPEVRLCLLSVSTIAVGLMFTARAYWMFLPHFAVWYLVTWDRLAIRASPPVGWWQWIRNSRSGFSALYAGLGIAVFLMSGGLGEPSAHSVLLGSGIFVHATIFHITVSLFMMRARP